MKCSHRLFFECLDVAFVPRLVFCTVSGTASLGGDLQEPPGGVAANHHCWYVVDVRMCSMAVRTKVEPLRVKYNTRDESVSVSTRRDKHKPCFFRRSGSKRYLSQVLVAPNKMIVAKSWHSLYVECLDKQAWVQYSEAKSKQAYSHMSRHTPRDAYRRGKRRACTLRPRCPRRRDHMTATV